MIQFPGKGPDGSFALHEVSVGNATYSAYYNADGSLKEADRIVWIRGVYHAINVPTTHRHVRHDLEIVGRRYARS